jgi:hypothetical protein
MVKQARSQMSDGEQEGSDWRRWMQRRLDGRVTLALGRP